MQGLFQSRLGTADYALVTSSLHYNNSLDKAAGGLYIYISNNECRVTEMSLMFILLP
jgi:hypothetical protein